MRRAIPDFVTTTHFDYHLYPLEARVHEDPRRGDQTHTTPGLENQAIAKSICGQERIGGWQIGARLTVQAPTTSAAGEPHSLKTIGLCSHVVADPLKPSSFCCTEVASLYAMTYHIDCVSSFWGSRSQRDTTKD